MKQLTFDGRKLLRLLRGLVIIFGVWPLMCVLTTGLTGIIVILIAFRGHANTDPHAYVDGFVNGATFFTGLNPLSFPLNVALTYWFSRSSSRPEKAVTVLLVLSGALAWVAYLSWMSIFYIFIGTFVGSLLSGLIFLKLRLWRDMQGIVKVI
jgi:hypothetical protein